MHAIVQKTEFTVGNAKIKIIMQDGFSKRGAERSVDMHQHPNFEIHYIEEGRFRLDCEGSSVMLERDTLIIIPPRCYHKFEGEGENLKRINFQLQLSRLKRGNNLYDGYEQLLSRLSSPVITQKIIGEFVKIGSMMGIISSDEELCRLNAYFTLAFFKIYDIIRQRFNAEPVESYCRSALMSRSDEEFTLMKILEFIRSNYARQLKLSDLSRFVSLSERQVQRILSARMGESFRDMLTKERITAAKSMLVNAEGEALALEEVAYRCGYTNYVSFWSQFKRETGFSPKQYKKRCGKK